MKVVVATTTDGAGDRNSWGTDLTRCFLELAPFVSADQGVFVDAVCEAFRASVIFDWQIAVAFLYLVVSAVMSMHYDFALLMLSTFFLEF